MVVYWKEEGVFSSFSSSGQSICFVSKRCCVRVTKRATYNILLTIVYYKK